MKSIEEITLCAIRYAMGRQSYVVSDVIDFTLTLEPYTKNFKEIASRDIMETLKQYPNLPYWDEWKGLKNHLLKSKTQ